MLSRRLIGSLSLALLGAALAVGCSATDDDESTFEGDGVGQNADRSTNPLVAEKVLDGSDLPDKTISLTFDDGPGRRTSELADFLASHGVGAAFFINGVRVSGRQAAVDSIVARGHLLANHTQNHKQLTTLSDGAIVREVEETDDIIAAVQPRGPWVLRAPYGSWSENIARVLNDSPMKKYVGSVFWDQGGALTSSAAADWDCWGKGVSVQRCGELYLQEIRSKRRGVVLMHDIHDKTVDMMKNILPTLIAEGYRFVPVQDVPSVGRAIRAGGGLSQGDDDGDDGRDDGSPPAVGSPCSTPRADRRESGCIQSRTDQKWYRCVDGQWAASTGLGDARCSQGLGL